MKHKNRCLTAGSTPFSALLSSNLPLRVACLSTPQALRRLTTALPADLVEIRLDLLLRNGLTLKNITSTLTHILPKSRTPILLTPRHPSEGGQYPWKSHKDRIALTLPLIPYAAAIDLELAHVTQLKPLYNTASEHSLAIILSTHSLTHPLTSQKIRALIKRFIHHAPHIAKIAALIESPNQLATLSTPLTLAPKLRWALMATGPHALIARTTLTTLGSRLLYGYLDSPTAPNQPSLAQINHLRATLSPLFSHR
jgi:3-dehydroquinate dehydratase-1